MFLGFFFCLVKFSKPKFIVLGTIFFSWLFILFLNALLKVVSPIKTNSNLPPKIYYENIVDLTLL